MSDVSDPAPAVADCCSVPVNQFLTEDSADILITEDEIPLVTNP